MKKQGREVSNRKGHRTSLGAVHRTPLPSPGTILGEGIFGMERGKDGRGGGRRKGVMVRKRGIGGERWGREVRVRKKGREGGAGE